MTTGTVTCRLATLADLPAIVGLLADDVLGASREQPADPLPAGYVNAFRAIDAEPNSELLVAERDGQVVGTVQVNFIAGISRGGMTRAQLEALRVTSAARGARIGQLLVEDVIARARARGCGLVQLTTDRRRTDAKRFYERLGFVDSHIGMKLAL